MTEYLVVSRAQSGIRLGKLNPLRLQQFPTSFGPADITIATRLVHIAGFTKPIPMGMMAEVRGVAPSLDHALEEFTRSAQSICAVLAFAGNSPIEDMRPEIAFDASPGVAEREFFQLFLPEERVLFIERRRLSSELVFRTLTAFLHHPEVERLRRAIGQYYQALRNWEPGQETLALAHLWMGIEALTPVVLRRVLNAERLDREGLATKWEVEPRHIDAEARKRLLLHGDAIAYEKAKVASDGFEHSFLAFDEVHAHSDAVRDGIAEHLRRSILDELALDPADFASLMSAPYSTPGHLRTTKAVRGTLVCRDEQLAASGEAYPYLEWKTNLREVPNESADDLTFKMDDTFTGHFADGVVCRLSKIEMRSGQESNFKPANNRSD